MLFTLIFAINISSNDIPFYSAKYKFESDEIKITGVREFKKNNDAYEMTFNASNLIASMNFSSEFQISNDKVYSNKYNIKIKPKFLNRDQSINFDYANNIIESSGEKKWKESINLNKIILDPLNAQIMIRTFVKKGAKSVYVFISHAVLSGNAIKNIQKSKIKKLIITDTIDNSKKIKKTNKIQVLSIAQLMAEAIKRISNSTSVSSLFN